MYSAWRALWVEEVCEFSSRFTIVASFVQNLISQFVIIIDILGAHDACKYANQQNNKLFVNSFV